MPHESPRSPGAARPVIFCAVLSRDDENALIAKAQAGDIAARNALIEDNLPKIKQLCARVYTFLPEGEKLGLAVEVFIRCIKHFKPDRGARLGTYMGLAVMGDLRRGLAQEKSLIKTPRAGRAAQPGTIANIERALSVRSIDAPTDHRFDAPLELADPDAHVDDENPHESLRQQIDALPEDMAFVLNGLLRGETQWSIAQHLGLSESRVSQLRTQALSLMRSRLTRPKEDSIRWIRKEREVVPEVAPDLRRDGLAPKPQAAPRFVPTPVAPPIDTTRRWQRRWEVPPKYCDCGCGKVTTICWYPLKGETYKRGERRRFVNGHHRKGLPLYGYKNRHGMTQYQNFVRNGDVWRFMDNLLRQRPMTVRELHAEIVKHWPEKTITGVGKMAHNSFHDKLLLESEAA